MRELHIVMPMAGEGSRFLKKGWHTPKPLILLNDKPLFIHAVRSISDGEIPIKHTFIVKQEHIDIYKIDKEIKKYISGANIISVEKTTRGAVETCMLAKDYITDSDGVLVMDCDLEFESKEYMTKVKHLLNEPIEKVNGGVLASFTSTLPKYSYALTDGSDRVIRTAEKEVISSNALCGAYFFATGRDFKTAALELLNDTNFDKPEFYVSLLFNRLLQKGQSVKLASIDVYKSYGTPEELACYIR